MVALGKILFTYKIEFNALHHFPLIKLHSFLYKVPSIENYS